MAQKRCNHPLDVTTGTLVFTPVLRATGERLHLEVDYSTFPRSNNPGFHGHTRDLKSGKWYTIYGKECDVPGCHCDAWVDELKAPPSGVDMPNDESAICDATAPVADLARLVGAIRTLLTIEGVEGIGQPVMLLSLYDLPPDVLGFVERLRGGCIETDEEMLVVTVACSPVKHGRKESTLARLREALMLLSSHAKDKGATTGDVIAVLDEVKRELSRQTEKTERSLS